MSHEPEETTKAPAATGHTREPIFTLVAVFVCALAFVTLFHRMMSVSWAEQVPVNIARGVDERRDYPKGFFDETDHRFVIWLVARNAWTLVTAPHELFQAEPCHPVDDVLALGEPGITMGLMGTPALLATREPLTIYNSVLFLVAILGFVAMFLLVRDWTGEPAAGIVAALLYAYHEIKIRDPVHFFAWDTSWTVFALYFASRLFRDARWRDAIGLAVVVGLQLGGSLYPLLTAVVIAGPIMVWLLVRHGVRKQSPLQWVFLLGFIGLAAAWIFTPYLAKTEAGVLAPRAYQVFIDFDWLKPAGPGFPGYVQLLLVACAFALPWRRLVGEGGPDPRWALLVVVLLLFSLSSGGNTAARLEALQRGEPPAASWPNLWDALAALVPGLQQVRGPAALWAGVHLSLSILAGIGMAAILRSLPERYRTSAAAASILIAWAELMRPAVLGLDPRIDYVTYPMRPAAEEIRFYAALEERGSEGPVLELPFNPRNLDQASRAVLLGAFHGRRIAQCFNSYIPADVHRVKAVADRLPDARAVAELAELGFTTLVVHPDPEPGTKTLLRSWRRELAAAPPEAGLSELALGEPFVAYRLRPTGRASASR